MDEPTLKQVRCHIGRAEDILCDYLGLPDSVHGGTGNKLSQILLSLKRISDRLDLIDDKRPDVGT